MVNLIRLWKFNHSGCYFRINMLSIFGSWETSCGILKDWALSTCRNPTRPLLQGLGQCSSKQGRKWPYSTFLESLFCVPLLYWSRTSGDRDFNPTPPPHTHTHTYKHMTGNWLLAYTPFTPSVCAGLLNTREGEVEVLMKNRNDLISNVVGVPKPGEWMWLLQGYLWLPLCHP